MARSLTVKHEENLRPSGLFLFFVLASAAVLVVSSLAQAADDAAAGSEPHAVVEATPVLAADGR
jgi:hypothetical protein